MNQNQHQYASSGVSTRGSMVLDSASFVPGSASGMASAHEEDRSSGLVTRPTSSMTRYEVYSQLTHSAPLVGRPLGSLLQVFSSNNQATSNTLDQRFNKLIKTEKKMMKQQEELMKDISSWCNVLPNDDCKKLLYHFIKVLEVEHSLNEQFVKKQGQIITQLSNVNKREKRTNDLKWKRNKMLSKLRESENKVGDSPITMLTKENLEELECSVEIVEDQFIRSINTGLKNSLVDYILTLQNAGSKYRETSKYFLENYNFNDKNGVNGASSTSNLQRLILQNKFMNNLNTSSSNSASVSGSASSSSAYDNEQDNDGCLTLENESRPISQASVQTLQKHHYIPISQNQVGKYLDNTFEDNENHQQAVLVESDHSHPSTTMLHTSNPTVLNVDKSELGSNNAGPPPTPEQKQMILQHQHQLQPSPQSTHSPATVDSTYIINSYSTPGSLGGGGGAGGVRPGSSQIMPHNHEWTT